MFEYRSFSEGDTERLGEKFASKLKGNEIVAFYGGMGMGKTAFIRGIVKGLGGKDEVSSPTFALVNEYDCRFKVYHFDMYRINNEESLESTGFYDFIDNGILLIEWSENVEEFIPRFDVKVVIDSEGKENERRIFIEGIDID